MSDAHEASSDNDAGKPYEEWTIAELRKRAAEAGVVGRSYMRKAKLIRALRNR